MYFLSCVRWSLFKKPKHVEPSIIRMLARLSFDWRSFVNLFADENNQMSYAKNEAFPFIVLNQARRIHQH
jgi:hypothetical protein